MKQPTKDDINMGIAQLVGSRGKCNRNKVGCIILWSGRIIASGYNGPIKKDTNCDTLHCNINLSCTQSIHAEANAISFAARRGISLFASTLYCTSSPCVSCAYLIIQAGITHVVYETPYHDETGIHILLNHGIEVRKYKKDHD